jgi:hypothetical protein
LREHSGDAEGSIGCECSGDEGGRDGGGEDIATGPSECETHVLAASYRQGSANSHESTVA